MPLQNFIEAQRPKNLQKAAGRVGRKYLNAANIAVETFRPQNLQKAAGVVGKKLATAKNWLIPAPFRKPATQSVPLPNPIGVGAKIGARVLQLRRLGVRAKELMK